MANTAQEAPVETLAGITFNHATPIGVDDETAKQLAADLDPARVKQVQGNDYLATHDVIRTANKVFGFGAWGHEIVTLELVGSEPMKNAKGEDGWYTGYRCVVRLTVAGCQPVSGVGYGDAFEKQWSAQVTTHELAAKEAESDALKRAFKNFGDQFGLILYAKVDDKRRIAAEKEAEAYNAPADDAAIAEVQRLADALDKSEAVSAALDREETEHGHVRSGWLARQLARLEDIAANGEPAPKTADESKSDAPLLKLAEGDRAATRDEVGQLLSMARQKGAGALLATETAIAGHRAKLEGNVVSATWLAKVTDALLKQPDPKPDEQTSETTTFAAPESATAETKPADVEAAFGEAA